MLLDSVRRLVASRYSLEQRRRVIASTEGYSRELWREFADLGLLSVNIPEEEGGLNAGPVGTLLGSMALGEALIVEPYLSSAVLATLAITKLATAAQRAQWLPQLAAGRLIMA